MNFIWWEDLPLFKEGLQWIYTIKDEYNHEIIHLTLTDTMFEKVAKKMKYVDTESKTKYIVIVAFNQYDKATKKRIQAKEFGYFFQIKNRFIFLMSELNWKPDKRERIIVEIELNNNYTKQIIRQSMKVNKFMSSICTYTSLFDERRLHYIKINNPKMKVSIERMADYVENPVPEPSPICGQNGGKLQNGNECKAKISSKFGNKVESIYYGRCHNHPLKDIVEQPRHVMKLIKVDLIYGQNKAIKWSKDRMGFVRMDIVGHGMMLGDYINGKHITTHFKSARNGVMELMLILKKITIIPRDVITLICKGAYDQLIYDWD